MESKSKAMEIMIDLLYFDSDCISSFLWVNEENLLLQLFPGRIVIPQAVYNELNQPRLPHFQRKLSGMLERNEIQTKEILVGSEEGKLYHSLSISPEPDQRIIGRGEAAVIALAKEYNGVVASNNLRDITQYIKLYDLKHITTADILVIALQNNLINEDRGNEIWSEMIRKRRLLPTRTFSDFLKSHN